MNLLLTGADISIITELWRSSDCFDVMYLIVFAACTVRTNIITVCWKASPPTHHSLSHPAHVCKIPYSMFCFVYFRFCIIFISKKLFIVDTTITSVADSVISIYTDVMVVSSLICDWFTDELRNWPITANLSNSRAESTTTSSWLSV